MKSTTVGQVAIISALETFLAESAERKTRTPWIGAADLASRAGATGTDDPQLQADVQALFDAGTIRLMSGGNASGATFYKAMLVPVD
jgi:hypothetical protein